MWFVALSLLQPAFACDRALLPKVGFYASADAIVVGKETGGQLLVERVLRGEAPVGKLEVTAQSVCGFPAPLPEKSTLIAMRKETDGSWTALEDHRVAATDAGFAAAESTVVGFGSLAWTVVGPGWATLAVVEPTRENTPAGVTIAFGVRNVSPEVRVLRWRDWPFEAHTHLELDVKGPAGPVHPKSNGIPEEDRKNYFSQHGRTFEVQLQPGQSHLFLVERIDTAPPGWGYKEDLDFAYYPMKAAGKYYLKPRMMWLAEVPLPANEVVVAR